MLLDVQFSNAARASVGNDIKVTNVKVTVMKPHLKSFIDNITVFSNGIGEAKSVPKRLDELTRMKFKRKKSRSCTIVKRKMRKVNFSITSGQIPTVNSVKCLGRWYEYGQSYRHKGREAQRMS